MEIDIQRTILKKNLRAFILAISLCSIHLAFTG